MYAAFSKTARALSVLEPFASIAEHIKPLNVSYEIQIAFQDSQLLLLSFVATVSSESVLFIQYILHGSIFLTKIPLVELR